MQPPRALNHFLEIPQQRAADNIYNWYESFWISNIRNGYAEVLPPGCTVCERDRIRQSLWSLASNTPN
ncbi:hypothetical protein P691DRAFT_801338 [Macrolepiota fuliginosa MF-IS2]|uniref:Uncharacterized protein n=1 Tax=Macrolepiota fuliginosa MF-IS2 TaxID=1400762 RepID=A0A9P5XCC3_9AGAR|nr:hypothetical protein P691DRAFT_801338 [Macrolepiota fuliginosa MF-IS2]